MEIYLLKGTYELYLEKNEGSQLIRIEVFESNSQSNRFRVRVWLQNTYNLYPTFMNLGPQGEDLKCVHSSDQLNTEITTLVAETPEWLTGLQCENEATFLELVLANVSRFLDKTKK